MAVAAQEVPKTQVDGTEEILTGIGALGTGVEHV